jgi:integrase
VAKGLTDIAIQNLKPGPARREIPDPGARGLYVIVQPSGHKSFAVRYRFDGRPKKLSLGDIPLSKARKAAAAALDDVKEGRDPIAAKQEAKAERRTVEANTFRFVAERFMTMRAGMRRDGDNVTFRGNIRTAPRQLRDLERAIFPKLGHRPVIEIKRSEIVALLDQIEMESGPVAADRALGLVRAILNWWASRSDDFIPPIVKGMARTSTKERARSRILTDHEIRAIFNSKEPGAFPALCRFLLLVGARRAEAANMTFEEIDGNNWNLPASRNKLKLDGLTRPLSAAALAVIESQRREGCPFVFSKARKPISTFSRDKKAFDEATGTAGWRVHDLRRTSRSLLSRAGVDADIGERCLGHALPGVRGTYDRHDYQSEMKRAYDALAALITQIAKPPEGNVTPLRKKKPAGKVLSLARG